MASITGGAPHRQRQRIQTTFTVNGSSTVTVGSTAGLIVGMPVTGTNIPANTTIAAILNGTQLRLSANATATSSVAPQSIFFGTSELDVTQNDTSAPFTIASNIRQVNSSITAGIPLAVVKAGAGTLILSGNNTYGGTTAVNEGTLQVGSATAIGQLNVGNNIVVSAVAIANKAGATFDISNFDTTIGNLSGGGTDGGTVTLGTHTLTIYQTASTTYSGTLTGAGNLVVVGSTAASAAANILTLNTTANNGFTGAVKISDAILALSNGAPLSGQTTANLTGATSFTIQNGGGLLIDNSGSVAVNRISSTAPITLSNTAPSGTSPDVGLSTQSDQAGVSSTATVGAVTLLYGANTLRAATAAASGANPQLDIASLTRSNNSTLVVLADGLDSPTSTTRGDIVAIDPTNIVNGLVGGGSTVAGTSNISILPWATGQAITTNTANATFIGNTFVTYSTVPGFGNGFRALTTSEYEQWSTDPNSGTTLSNNVRYAASGGSGIGDLTLTNTGPNQMNSLLVQNTSTTTPMLITGTGQGLNVQSGAFLFLGSATPQGITLTGFGDGSTTGITTGTNNEYIFHVMNTSAAGVTINDFLATAGASLTKDGPGTLVLTATNSNLTGTITLNQGLLQISFTGNIGGDNATFGNAPAGSDHFPGWRYPRSPRWLPGFEFAHHYPESGWTHDAGWGLQPRLAAFWQYD